jgi:hypothetical protein
MWLQQRCQERTGHRPFVLDIHYQKDGLLEKASATSPVECDPGADDSGSGIDFELLVNPVSDPAAWHREMLKTATLRQAMTKVGQQRFVSLVRSARVAEEICRGSITIGMLEVARDQQRATCRAVLALR